MTKMSLRVSKLNEFLEKHKNTAPQGTIEWLNSRKFRIGGSEISIVLGCNPYSNEKKLIKQHVGLSNFVGYAATFFGNLIEPILTDYISNYFNCFIHETGSINTNRNLGYSPDGVASINKKYLDNILNNDHFGHIKDTSLFVDNHEDDDVLVLFEFKCPFKRIPHKTDIPVYYLPQPLLGMDIINICEVGIFIEAMYRFCSLDDIKYDNSYNNGYHCDKLIITKNPLYHGFMVISYNPNDFSYTDNNESDESDDTDFLDDLESNNQFIHNIKMELDKYTYIQTNINGLIVNDLGKLKNKYIVNQIMGHIIEKKQFNYKHIPYSESHLFDNEIFNKTDNIKEMYDYDIKINIQKDILDTICSLNDEVILGVLPYKLFDIYMKPVNKKINFITDEVQSRVNDIVGVIKECCDGEKTVYDKEKIINEFCKNK